MAARTVAFLIALLAALSIAASPQPITIPAGTSVHFKLNQTINTATAKAGQHVPAELTAPIVVDGRTIANAGSAATVKIRTAEESGRMGGSAKITFRLSSIT